MKNSKAALLAVALSASLLTVAGCGGAGDDASGGSTGTAPAQLRTEPSDGIPASYRGTLPMPEVGKDYTNPRPRADVRDGGTLTLPIAQLGPNFNNLSADGNSTDVLIFSRRSVRPSISLRMDSMETCVRGKKRPVSVLSSRIKPRSRCSGSIAGAPNCEAS